ncbi:glutamate racemase [Schleiferiaceae bacterium]|nr:glutamate racemase [Bacteroidota bacterium]MDA7804895.1 glutamate racemase [Schleiferiaceae bacterium]MDA8564558.1 glutamate racemase [Schleiferiaceae bacterium]MDA9192102.1 glutamate racemase [Schleiferiaceae bacterium]
MKKQRKIGLFDSGLGGLTVLRALEEKLPQVDKVYYGDTLHLPYGDKSDEAIRAFSREIVGFLAAEGCDVIVIACNSASAAAGTMLEESFPDLTFINVIDPVVASLAQGPQRKTALLGTRATVRSGAYTKRLDALRVAHELIALPTPLLVPLIEDGFLGTGIEISVLEHYLNDPSLEGIEAIVPGCTHYPLLRKAAAKLRPGVDWIDAPAIVAEAVVSACGAAVEGSGTTTYYLSDATPSFLALASSTFGITAHWDKKVL